MIDYILNSLLSPISSNILQESTKRKIKNDINNYISNTFEKFRLTKNLLFRNEPTDFFKNYIPLSLLSNNKKVRVVNPLILLDKFDKIAILGNAGSGKTTFLRYLTLMSIREGNYIPVYVELRLFGGQSLRFEEFISKLISDEPTYQITELFKSGKFLFLLDGFDEINYSEGANAINEIQNFISTYSKNNFILSSRPGTNVESMNEFHVYELASLSENDIKFYIEKLNLSNSKKDLFFESIENDSYFHQYLTTPLFLSIYINYILSHGGSDFPKNKSIFFRNIIDTLFSKHDAVSKLGFVRTKLSGLNKDELERIASILAFRGLLTGQYSFSKDILIKELELIKRNQNLTFENDKLIYDLSITVNILIDVDDFYAFVHVLIMEYLASLFISRLPQKEKSIFYSKILAGQKIHLSSSLINFLYELDAQTLVKEFLIPKLENFSFSYSKDISDVIVNDFIKFHFQDDNSMQYGGRGLIERLKKQFRIQSDNDLGELFSF